jgi:hypothetical protein
VFTFELSARVVELDLEAFNLAIFGSDILGHDIVGVAAIFTQALTISRLFLLLPIGVAGLSFEESCYIWQVDQFRKVAILGFCMSIGSFSVGPRNGQSGVECRHNACGHDIPTSNQLWLGTFSIRTHMPLRHSRIDKQTDLQSIRNETKSIPQSIQSCRPRTRCNDSAGFDAPRKRKSMMNRRLTNSKIKRRSRTESFQACLAYKSQLG